MSKHRGRLSDLIQALQIALRYGDPTCPTHCEHDVMWLVLDPGKVSEEDMRALAGLGFFADDDDECFKSYRFGSA